MNGRLLTAAPSLSVTPVELAILSLSVPSPVIDDTVTVRVVPDPATLLIVPATVPVVVVLKLVVPPPVRLSLNVTVKSTLEAFVGFAFARLMERTVGTVLATS